jgi:hypothetical protein
MSQQPKTKVFWTQEERNKVKAMYDQLSNTKHEVTRINKAIIKALPPKRRRYIASPNKLPWLGQPQQYIMKAPAIKPPVELYKHILDSIVGSIEELDKKLQSYLTEAQITSLVENSVREILTNMLLGNIKKAKPVLMKSVSRYTPSIQMDNRYIPVVGLTEMESNQFKQQVPSTIARGYHSYLGLDKGLRNPQVSSKLLLAEDLLVSKTAYGRTMLGIVDKYYKGEIIYFTGGLKGAQAKLTSLSDT